MRLDALRAVDFRNFAWLSLSFDPQLNLFVGDNGQGKTNLLEAIYVLGQTKSFRTHALQEAIRHGGAGWQLQADLYSRDQRTRLQISLEGRTKSLQVDDKNVDLVDYLGHLDAVAVTSYHSSTIRGYPDQRRRFIDRALLYLRPHLIGVLSRYQKIVRQKNALLVQMKKGASAKPDELEAWNQELVEQGTTILLARRDLVADLRRTLRRGLFATDEIGLIYRPGVPIDQSSDRASGSEIFRRRLVEVVDQEIAAGYSLVGPHKDDLEVLLEGRSLQRFGSAGQQRSALYGLHFAILELYFECRQDYPVFLIDDIDAELDVDRIHTLVDHLIPRCQVFITSAKKGLVEKYLANATTFVLEQGKLV